MSYFRANRIEFFFLYILIDLNMAVILEAVTWQCGNARAPGWLMRAPVKLCGACNLSHTLVSVYFLDYFIKQ